MFSTILIPLDGSEHSDSILIQVRRLLLQEDAQVHLLGVAPSKDRDDRHVSLRLEEARRHVAEQAERLGKEGVLATSDAVVGDPAATILTRVEHDRPSLVAMATHGRGGLRRMIRGSVAERVLRACPVPLLLANPNRDGGAGVGFRRLLVPLDGSERSASILPVVTQFAQIFDAQVTLLRVGFVVHPDVSSMSVVTVLDNEQLEASLQPAREALEAAGVEATVRICFGDPAAEILAVAEQDDVDLVAMSTHGHSGIDRWLFGSVAENVLRHCGTPLLVQRTVTQA